MRVKICAEYAKQQRRLWYYPVREQEDVEAMLHGFPVFMRENLIVPAEHAKQQRDI